MHDPYEGLRDIYQNNGPYSFDDIGEEQVDGPACEIGEREERSFFVGEDADLVLCLDGEVLDDLPNFKGVFIYILFIPQGQNPRSTHDKHRRHRTLIHATLKLS
jgi:hypothetical protein